MVGPCPYCGEPLVDRSPEHVIPRSLGAHDLVVVVCGRCNRQANRLIDQAMTRCAVVRRWRADANVIDLYGRPYRVEMVGDVVSIVPTPSGDVDLSNPETLASTLAPGLDHAMPGARVIFGDRSADKEVRFAGSSGQQLVDGHRLRYCSEPHVIECGAIDGQRGDGSTMLMLAKVTARGCSHDLSLWRRFAAKVGLGAIAFAMEQQAADTGPRGVDMSEPTWSTVVEGLRSIAFDPSSEGTGCDPYQDADGSVAPWHQVNVVNDSGGLAVQVLLFGSLDLRARVPGLEVGSGFTLTVPARTDVRPPLVERTGI